MLARIPLSPSGLLQLLQEVPLLPLSVLPSLSGYVGEWSEGETHSALSSGFLYLFVTQKPIERLGVSKMARAQAGNKWWAQAQRADDSLHPYSILIIAVNRTITCATGDKAETDLQCIQWFFFWTAVQISGTKMIFQWGNLKECSSI